VLGVLTGEQLAHALFPLGDTPKGAVRAEAARRGLALADKPDSHDICFIADGDTAGFLRRRLGTRPGALVDETGVRVGAHDGAYAYTIGQRRGLGLGTPAADGRPRYVLDIEPVSGTVTVGSHDALAVGAIDAVAARWCGAAPDTSGGALACTVQLRAHGEPVPARVQRRDGGAGSDAVHLRLDVPAHGVAPGQAAVVYLGTRVVGSATITRTYRAVPA